MKKLQLALLLTLTVIVLLIIAIFSAPTFINWQNNKGIIENVASDFLGNRIKIEGDLQVQLLPNPKVYAENIVIDSVSEDENIVEVEHVILTKKLSDLLLLDFSIDELVINRPSFNLVTDMQGANNWEPLKLKNSNYYSRKLKSALKGAVKFKKIVVENATISYVNELTSENSLASNIYFDVLTKPEVININGKGSYNDVEQKIHLNLDITNPKVMRVKSMLSNQEYMVSLEGLVNSPYNLNRAQFVGKLNSEFEDGNKVKFNKTLATLSKKYFDLKQLKLKSDFTVSKNKFSMSMIELDSKYNKLSGNIDYFKDRSETDLSLKLDIDKIYIKKEESFSSNSTKLEWPDKALDFSFVNNLRVSTSINCVECTYGNNTFYQINLKSNLENSNLIVNQFNLKASDKGFIKLSATASLNSPFAFETKLEANEFPLGSILPLGVSKKIVFDLNGAANISASGVSPKAMMSNLTGSFNFDTENLKLKNIDDTSVKAAIEGLLYNKNRVSFNSEIGALKLDGSIRDGVLRTSDIEFKLSGEDIVSKGKFDLANLAMNYRIQPVELRRNNLGIVLSGNINKLDIISDKITPKGVVDGFNRVVTTSIVKKAKKPEVKTPFDFDDSANLEENVKNYLFDK